MVTVDSSGGLAELHLSDGALRLSPEELSQVIMATSRRAQATLAQQVAEIVGGLYGPESETAGFITGAYSSQFPEPVEEDEESRQR